VPCNLPAIEKASRRSRIEPDHASRRGPRLADVMARVQEDVPKRVVTKPARARSVTKTTRATHHKPDTEIHLDQPL
jgi:hypothetical protein